MRIYFFISFIIFVFAVCSCDTTRYSKCKDHCKEYFGTTKFLGSKVIPKQPEGSLYLNVLKYSGDLTLDSVMFEIVNRKSGDTISQFGNGSKFFDLPEGDYNICISKLKFQKYIIAKVPISDSTTIINISLGPDCSHIIDKIYDGITW